MVTYRGIIGILWG